MESTAIRSNRNLRRRTAETVLLIERTTAAIGSARRVSDRLDVVQSEFGYKLAGGFVEQRTDEGYAQC